MKNSIKISILLSALFGITIAARAQTTTGAAAPSTSSSGGTILSIGADGGFSIGKFKDNSKWNLGGSLQADIPVADNIYFTANAGYDNFFGKKNVDGTGLNAPAIHLLPVKAGIKYFPIGLLYIQGDAGAAFALNKSKVDYDKTAAFIYVPQVGVQLPLGGKSYIDAGVYYEASTKFTTGDDDSKINFLGARIAYAFSVK